MSADRAQSQVLLGWEQENIIFWEYVSGPGGLIGF